MIIINYYNISITTYIEENKNAILQRYLSADVHKKSMNTLLIMNIVHIKFGEILQHRSRDIRVPKFRENVEQQHHLLDQPRSPMGKENADYCSFVESEKNEFVRIGFFSSAYLLRKGRLLKGQNWKACETPQKI